MKPLAQGRILALCIALAACNTLPKDPAPEAPESTDQEAYPRKDGLLAYACLRMHEPGASAWICGRMSEVTEMQSESVASTTATGADGSQSTVLYPKSD